MKHFNEAVWSRTGFLKQNITLASNSYNLFIVFMQIMNINCVCQVRVIRNVEIRSLSLPKHRDIKLNFMTQTREKLDSHVLSRW